MPRRLGPLARDLAIAYYENALPAHDQFHAKRVRDVSLRLATDWDETVDDDILAAAAWLHDIGRPRERTGDIDDHDQWATQKAGSLLEDADVTADRIDAIQHCISAHSIRASSPEPASPEAKLVFDADKLDATGARGIVRLACIVGERSGRASESHAVIDDTAMHDMKTQSQDIALLKKWARERLDHLYTPPGRRLGESRWQFMETFFEQFDREMSPLPND